MEKLVALCLIFVGAASAHPLLLWSSSDLRSFYKIALGTDLSDPDFNNKILAPLCGNAQFVVFNVDNLSYVSLSEVADETSPGWSFVKNALMGAKLEKLLEYSGKGENPALCGAQYIPIKDRKDVTIDEQLRDAGPKLSGDKPVVYIIRSVNNVAKSEQTKRINRRQATVDTTSPPKTGNISGYVIDECYLMNYKMITFLPLGKDWGDVKPFAVTNWANKDTISCPTDTKTFE
ncbi:uncharacterized protein LOC142356225 [Convolutriloba macropyga]|uniref:uncharacterized protein LOC142356225 n=1 Tax=Convolutriloba macropyga TaxID=536237 RepID=UPI003F51ED8E